MKASLYSNDPSPISHLTNSTPISNEEDEDKGWAGKLWDDRLAEDKAVGQLLYSKKFDDETIETAQRGNVLFLRTKLCRIRRVEKIDNKATFTVEYYTLNKVGIIETKSTEEKFLFVAGRGEWLSIKDNSPFKISRLDALNNFGYLKGPRAVRCLREGSNILENGIIILPYGVHSYPNTIAVWTLESCVMAAWQNVCDPEPYTSLDPDLEKLFHEFFSRPSEEVLEIPRKTEIKMVERIVFHQNRLLVSHPLQFQLPPSVCVILISNQSNVPVNKHGYYYIMVADSVGAEDIFSDATNIGATD